MIKNNNNGSAAGRRCRENRPGKRESLGDPTKENPEPTTASVPWTLTCQSLLVLLLQGLKIEGLAHLGHDLGTYVSWERVGLGRVGEVADLSTIGKRTRAKPGH